MEYYLLLTTSTFIILLLAILIWEKGRDVSFLLGIGLLYYFSLFGAWAIVYDNLTGGKGADFGLHYYYLFDKLFPIYLNKDYFLTIIFYSIFIIIIELTLLLRIKNRNIKQQKFMPLQISHFRLILITAICLAGSFFIIKDYVLKAYYLNESAYLITRASEGGLFTIHQILNLAIIPLIIGFVIYINGKNGFFIIGRRSRIILLVYSMLLIIWVGYLAVLGNKRELLSGLIVGVLFYLANDKRPRKILLVLGTIFSAIIFYSIDTFRSFSPSAYIYNINPIKILLSFYSIFLSNEMMASHFSMYGVLNYNTPLVWGYSVKSLFASVVPRIFWSSRPSDIYLYYADYIGATRGQGYTIHHATGWYLNFGFWGIVAGGIILGMFWSWCFNIFRRPKDKKILFYVFSILAPWLFVGGIVSLTRSGIEGYKGLFLENLFMPTLIITISSLKIKWEK